MIWSTVPVPAKAQWAQRRGAWLRRWLSLIVVFSENLALLTWLTALGRLYPRADHVLWLSLRPRLLVLWALFGAETVLVGAVTWVKARADAASDTREPRSLGLAPSEQRKAANSPRERTEPAESAPVLSMPQVQPAWRRSNINAIVPLPPRPDAGDVKAPVLSE